MGEFESQTVHSPTVTTPWWVVGLLVGAVVFEVVVRVGMLTLPGEVAAATRFFSPEQIELAHERLHPLRVLGFLQTVVHSAVLVLLAVSAPGARLLHAIEQRARGPWRTLAAYLALHVLLQFVVPVPFQLAAREQRRAWGLSAQPHLDWLGEYVLTQTLDLAVVCGLVVAIFALLRRAPRRGWLVAGFSVAGAIVLGAMLWPVLVDPLFNDFTPISATKYAPVESQLRPLAAAAGLGDVPLYVMDASRQGEGTNAYVTGLGGTTRIVLYDTLLDRDDTVTLQATFAHEVGHWALGHHTRGVVLMAMMSFVAFFLLWRLLARLVGTTHVSPRAVADPRAFFLVSALAWAAQTLTDPMPCALSRADEVAADDFGLALTRAPAGWIDDERRFVLENYDDPVPHPLRQLRSTHPHGVQRIARVCTRAPAMCDDVLGKPLAERARVTISLDPSDDNRVREALRPEDAAGDPGILVFFHTEDPTRTPRAVVTYAREWRSGREESVVVHDAPSLASDVRTWDGRSGFSHEHERRGDVREDRAVFKRRLGTGSIDAVRSGERLAHTLFSIPQQRFAHNEPWEKLRVGVTVETLQWTALLDGNPVVLERWRLPDGSALLEVSATCSPERAESVHAQLAALVTRSGAQVAARPSSLVRSAMLAVHPHPP